MKTIRTLCAALLLTLLPCTTGLCAATPDVVPVDGSALLVRVSDQALLIGGKDEQAVESALSSGIQGVVRLCDHAEHSAAVDALASHYGVAVYAPGSEIPVSGAAWQGQTLTMDIAGTPYVFGADSAQDGAITYRCDGSVYPYAGQTNESAVNIRKDTSTKSAKVGRLQRGDTLYILDTVQNAGGEYWYSVQLADGTTGYIRSDLVMPAIGAAVSATVARGSSPSKDSGAESAGPSGSGTKYIGNKKTKVFHTSTCGSLPSGKNQVTADSRSYFIAIGYRPCQKCNP